MPLLTILLVLALTFIQIDPLPTERARISPENVDQLIPLETLALADVRAMAFNSDGTQLAVGGADGLSVWDVTTLDRLSTLTETDEAVDQVAISPDNRYIAYSAEDLLFVADVRRNRINTPFDAPSDIIHDLAFNRTGLLTVGDGSTFDESQSSWSVYDVRRPMRLIADTPTDSWVRDIGFSPDGSLFAVLDTELHIYDTASGDQAYLIQLVEPPSGGLAWQPFIDAPNPLRIAFSDGANVRLVELETGRELGFAGDVDFFPGEITFSPDGELLAAINVPPEGADIASTVNIWDALTADLLSSTPLIPATALAFSPDGTLLVIATDDEVIFLGVDEGEIAVG